MTAKEFNEKYKEFIQTQTYKNKQGVEVVQTFDGLSIGIPSVVEFLDNLFEEITKIPGFRYSQIKLKFNMARVYTNSCGTLNYLIEDKIDQLVKEFDKQHGI